MTQRSVRSIRTDIGMEPSHSIESLVGSAATVSMETEQPGSAQVMESWRTIAPLSRPVIEMRPTAPPVCVTVVTTLPLAGTSTSRFQG
jgi:hypothetical protein